jgi:hypothetical protein
MAAASERFNPADRPISVTLVTITAGSISALSVDASSNIAPRV